MAFLSGTCVAQFELNYTPVSLKPVIPEELKIDYVSEIKNAVANEKELSEETAKLFYEELSRARQAIFKNGNIYFDDELTGYVRAVAEIIYKQNPDLKNKVKIYVTRFSSANAVAMADGSVFVNVGLLSSLESESQLAFILAHEIAHIELSHSIKCLKKISEITNQEHNNDNQQGMLFRSLRYSREDETEADSKALKLLLNTRFDAYDGIYSLKQITDTLFKIKDIKYILNSFGSEYITIDSTYFKTTNTNTNNSSDLISSDTRDDFYQTHPEVGKRITTLKELLKIVDYKGEDKHKYILHDSVYVHKIKMESTFEMIENTFRNVDYNTSFYLSLYMREKFPDNLYIKSMLIKNLYWVNLYKEIESFPEIMDYASIYPAPESLKIVNSFFLNLSHMDTKKILYGYTKRSLAAYPENEELVFYNAMVTEKYLGKETGSFLYNGYLLKFPNGKYAPYIKQKI